MRFADILRLALSALAQQKVRTALTTLGVVVGSFVLILSLSIGRGVQEAARRELLRHDQLRKILVYSSYRVRESDVPAEEIQVKGDMSEAKRARLRQAIIRDWRGKSKGDLPRRLTPKRMRELAALEHVQSVVPGFYRQAQADLADRRRGVGVTVSVAGVSAADREFRARVVAGDFFTAPGERSALVNEYLLYRLGIADDADVRRVLGTKLRLVFRSFEPRTRSLLFLLNGGQSSGAADEEAVLGKVLRQLPGAVEKLDLTPAEKGTLRKVLTQSAPKRAPPVVVEEDFTIVGVVRDPTQQERRSWGSLNADADVLLPAQTARELADRDPAVRADGFGSAVVTVDREENVAAVQKRIVAMGLEPYSLADAIEQIRFNAVMITFATAFVALVALLVSALGITNTMLMSVLERTHEIGVMKAVGARDRHVQWMFLVEGALVGVLGGGLGLLLAWVASIPGDAVARRLAEKQANAHLDQSLFVFPWWLAAGVPAGVALLTMLAAVYPARRAARVNPITALRHE